VRILLFHALVQRNTLPLELAPARLPTLLGCSENRHGMAVMCPLSRNAPYEAERLFPLRSTEITSIALFMFPTNRLLSFQLQIALQA